jgi:hypothetical protein
MLLSANVEAMEAMVAERGAKMAEWNDGRLDDLGDRVDRIEKKMDAGFIHIDQRFKETDQKMEAGFARLDKKMDDGFARIDAKFDVMAERFQTYDERFNSIYQLLFKASWAVVIGILGLLGVVIGVIGAQS